MGFLLTNILKPKFVIVGLLGNKTAIKGFSNFFFAELWLSRMHIIIFIIPF